MRLNTYRSVFRFVAAAICVTTSHLTLAIESTSTPDPLDAGATVAPLVYRSSLSGDKGRYLKDTDVARLPWRKLFESDGRFATEPSMAANPLDRAPVTPTPMRSATATTSTQPSSPTSTASSDTRGVIKSIDVERARVKLKHGPIEKFDMPGMTMIFRIKDPRLFEQVSQGDEVGVTLEMDRGAMYITGFQK